MYKWLIAWIAILATNQIIADRVAHLSHSFTYMRVHLLQWISLQVSVYSIEPKFEHIKMTKYLAVKIFEILWRSIRIDCHDCHSLMGRRRNQKHQWLFIEWLIFHWVGAIEWMKSRARSFAITKGTDVIKHQVPI